MPAVWIFVSFDQVVDESGMTLVISSQSTYLRNIDSILHYNSSGGTGDTFDHH
jgi:hypothetical protein